MKKGWILSGIIIVLMALALACEGSTSTTATPGAAATTSTPPPAASGATSIATKTVAPTSSPTPSTGTGATPIATTGAGLTSSPTPSTGTGATSIATATSIPATGAAPTATATSIPTTTPSGATPTSTPVPTATPTPMPAPDVTFTVDTTIDAVDANPGDGVCADSAGNCTLRAAIMEANAVPGAAAITLPGGTYTLSIPLVGSGAGFITDENAAETGDLDITDDLTISGAGADTTIVDGGALDRVFHIMAESTVSISGVTIQNGTSSTGGGISN